MAGALIGLAAKKGLMGVFNVAAPWKFFGTKAVVVAADQLANEGEITDAALDTAKGVWKGGGDVVDASKKVFDGDIDGAKVELSSAATEMQNIGTEVTNAYNATSTNITTRTEQVEVAQETLAAVSEAKKKLENADLAGLAGDFMKNSEDWDFADMAKSSAPFLAGAIGLFSGDSMLGKIGMAALGFAMVSIVIPMIMDRIDGNSPSQSSDTKVDLATNAADIIRGHDPVPEMN